MDNPRNSLRFYSTTLAISLFVFLSPVWSQHSAHTHGKAELNLVLQSDRELIAELIAPAESVYGFEHAPRNQEERVKIEAGLNQLKASLSELIAMEKRGACKTIEIAESGYTGDSGTHSKDHHAHKHSKPSKNDHHHTSNHHNVTIRWKLSCGSDLTGQVMILNWSQALADIQHMEVTLLTPTRQEALSFRRSGSKFKL